MTTLHKTTHSIPKSPYLFGISTQTQIQKKYPNYLSKLPGLPNPSSQRHMWPSGLARGSQSAYCLRPIRFDSRSVNPLSDQAVRNCRIPYTTYPAPPAAEPLNKKNKNLQWVLHTQVLTHPKVEYQSVVTNYNIYSHQQHLGQMGETVPDDF